MIKDLLLKSLHSNRELYEDVRKADIVYYQITEKDYYRLKSRHNPDPVVRNYSNIVKLIDYLEDESNILIINSDKTIMFKNFY